MTRHDTHNWVGVCSLDDIPRRGARVLKTDAGCVAIFRTQDDRVFALDDECPHKKGPLSQGIVHGDQVTCPLHNWVISLETGEAQGADEGKVSRKPVKLEDGKVYMKFAHTAISVEA